MLKEIHEIQSKQNKTQTEWEMFVNGDNHAISSIYKRYLPSLLFVAYSYLEDDEKSKDVVGDTFEQLIQMSSTERAKKLAGVNKKLETFLKVIVKNRCLNLKKIEKNRKNILRNIGPLFIYNTNRSFTDMTDYGQLIELLPNRQREVFTLHVAGFKNEEIAGQLEISINTAKNTLVNSKKKLRELYNIFMV